MKNIVHFGAGKLGRGVIGKMYYESGSNIKYVDANEKIVNLINLKKQFTIHLIGDQQSPKIVKNVSALMSGDEAQILKIMYEADIISTSVVPNNLVHLVDIFNKFLSNKKENPQSKHVNIVCIENGIKVTNQFKKTLENANLKNVSFINAIADGICMLSDSIPYEDVLMENYTSVIFEGKNWVGEKIKDVKYPDDIEPDNMMKFWLANSSQWVIAILSYGKFKYVYEFTKDPEIVSHIKEYMSWISQTLEENYSSLTKEKIKDYENFIFKRMSSDNIKDNINRIIRNFKLKVSREDRIVSIINKSSNPKIGIETLKKLYELNIESKFDEEISNYTKEKGIEKAILKYSKLSI